MRKFAGEMSDLGFDGIDENKQFAMAVHDVTLEFARTMKAEKLSGFDTEKLIAFRIFDVNPQFIREMRAEGLSATDSDSLIAFRVHGVSSRMVRELKNAGIEVDEDQLIAFRVHGVTPEFAAKVEAMGFKDVEPDQLIAMRVHGVTPEFISEMKSRGLKDLSIDKLVACAFTASTRFHRPFAPTRQYARPCGSRSETSKTHGPRNGHGAEKHRFTAPMRVEPVRHGSDAAPDLLGLARARLRRQPQLVGFRPAPERQTCRA